MASKTLPERATNATRKSTTFSSLVSGAVVTALAAFGASQVFGDVTGLSTATAKAAFFSPLPWSDKLSVTWAVRSSGSCCEALAKVHDTVATPSSSQYTTFVESWWSAIAGEPRPDCVVYPQSKHDVAKTVFLLTLGDDRYGEGACNFAFRGGGHTPHAGAANIDKGVTIDMSGLRRTVLSDDRKTVHIGPGAKWLDVYSTLIPEGLVTVGGRVSSVGVGGLSTGGGISFFSPRYGFVCNGVVSFEVVLANGGVLNVTADSHPDLWRALKGGSSNFGIVTDFEMKTYAQGEYWGGTVLNYIDSIDQQADLFEKFANASNYDRYASNIHAYGITTTPSQIANTWFVSNFIQYTKYDPPVTNPDIFKEIQALPQLYNSTRVASLTDFTNELQIPNPPGLRQVMVTRTFRVDARLEKLIVKHAQKVVADLLDMIGLTYAVVFQALPTVFTENSRLSGGDSLGLDPEHDGNLVVCLLSISYTEKANDERVQTSAKDIMDYAQKTAEEMGLAHRYIYLNYASPWQNPIEGYGPESVEQLRAVSEKYDPKQVFQRMAPGGFKVFF